MNFGLTSHRLHRLGPDSSLLRWARACEPGLRALGLGLHATGGAFDALQGVFFRIDPVDPTSIYPEALARKRLCAIHGKPFVATRAARNLPYRVPVIARCRP